MTRPFKKGREECRDNSHNHEAVRTEHSHEEKEDGSSHEVDRWVDSKGRRHEKEHWVDREGRGRACEKWEDDDGWVHERHVVDGLGSRHLRSNGLGTVQEVVEGSSQ